MIWICGKNACLHLLFLSLQESGPLESEAMVMGVLNEAFDVLVLKYGVQKRIYCNVSLISDMGNESTLFTVLYSL